MLLWVLTVYSKDYTIEYVFPVKYTNVPRGKVIASSLPSKIKLSLKGSGFSLMGYELFGSSARHIVMDLSKARYNPFDNDFTFDTRFSLDTITRQLNENLLVTKIYPENILFKVRNKSFKTVPVKLNAFISYKQQFQLNGKIVLNPSEIQVSGDSMELTNLSEIETETVNLRNLEKSISKNINLIVPENSITLEVLPAKVRLSVPVEKYTESTISTKIVTDNVPRGFTIKTFPEKVTVTFQVSIDRYKDIKEDMFVIRADYNEQKDGKSNKLKLQLVKVPEFVRNARIQPEKVEFILKKL